MAKLVLRVGCYESYESGRYSAKPSNAEILIWDGNSLRTTSTQGYLKIAEELSKDHWDFVSYGAEDLIKGTFHPRMPTLLPRKYIKARLQLLENCHSKPKENYTAQMQGFLPPKMYWKLYIDYCKALSQELDNYSLEYYQKLEKLSFEPAYVSVEDLDALLADPTTTNKNVLEGFRPVPGGAKYTCSVRYTRNNTRTGRMTVESGPNILILKKEYRKIFRSRWKEEGKLWSFDYTSLEPRVLLLLGDLNKRYPSSTPLIGRVPRDTMSQDLPRDIYSKVLEDLGLTGKLPRNIAKNSILATLYGQSEHNAVKALKNHISKPEDFLAAISDYFGVTALQQNLSRDLLYSNRNEIRSYYGRPILCEDTRPSALLNYYIQATAVDVALKGFSRILNRLIEKELSDNVRPIFCLHDALVLDMQRELEYLVPQIENVGSKKIEGFQGVNFYLRAQDFVPSSLPTEEEAIQPSLVFEEIEEHN